MKIRNQTGGTLIEAIMAMLILALIIVGLNAGVLSLIKSNLTSKELSAATSSAYSLFEDLKNKDYADIQTNYDVVNNKYLRAWNVTTESSQKKINVSIVWPLQSYSHRIELSTIIAKP